MKTYGGVGIDPHFLDLGTRWRCVVNFAALALYPWRKGHRYLLGGPQRQSGSYGERQILDPTGTRNPTSR
jgi:hypothetical protein